MQSARVKQLVHLTRTVLLQTLDLSRAVSSLIVHPKHLPEHHLHEAERLVESLSSTLSDNNHHQYESLVVGSSRREKPHPATYFGKGVVEQIAAVAAAQNIDKVVINTRLSGIQQRNLEAKMPPNVATLTDRVGLILEIFNSRAKTSEARLQVEIAQLNYMGSRLVRSIDAATGRRLGFGADSATQVVSARERGSSGGSRLGGSGGAGESELQLQSRRLAQRKAVLQQRLDAVRKTRAVQRAGRKKRDQPVIAVLGYTNAGKSSLVSALSKRPVESQDQLFHTLDPTLRRVQLSPRSNKSVILSDTVGFITDLPIQLIEAFKATLEEVVHADILLHVLDAASPHVAEQKSAVLSVLKKLGITQEVLDDRMIEVWNKCDLVLDMDVEDEATQELIGRYKKMLMSSDGSTVTQDDDYNYNNKGIPVSVKESVGLKQLLQMLEAKVDSRRSSSSFVHSHSV